MQQLLLGKHIELSEQHIHQHRERQSAAAISPSRFDTLPENADFLCSTSVFEQSGGLVATFLSTLAAAAVIAVKRELELFGGPIGWIH